MQAHGQLDEGVARFAEGVRLLADPGQALGGIGQLARLVHRVQRGGGRQQRIQALRTEFGVDAGVALQRGAVAGFVDLRHEGLFQAGQARLDEGQVAFLVAALALGVRLLALQRQAVQGACALEQVAVGGLGPGGFLARLRHVGGDHAIQFGQQVLRAVAVLLVPGAELGVLHILDGGDVLAREAVEQALGLLEHVVQALVHARVAHVPGRVAHGGGGDHGQVGGDAGDLGREVDVAREADL